MTSNSKIKPHHFTGIEDPLVEQLLRQVIQELGEEIRALGLSELSAVWLGGGYGRGEGGVFHTTNGGRLLYNDLDFFVAVEERCGKSGRYQVARALDELAQTWSQRLGISVDFSPAKSRRELEKVSKKLMFQELRHGFVTVYGEDELLLRAVPSLPPEKLPFLEALRLMLNRGMGLLLARQSLQERPEDANFFLRNLNKCVLGCGDAFLIQRGLYRWNVRERQNVLALQNHLPETLKDDYARAVQFKFRPNANMPADPRRSYLHCRELWLTSVHYLLPLETKAEKIRTVLHRICQREAACNLKNFLRWEYKLHSLEFSGMSFDEPFVRILADLYDAVRLETPDFSSIYRAWRYFN